MDTPASVAWFTDWLARTSLQAGVLILLILGARILLRDRVAPAWRHGLWLLLVARLALPWSPPSRLSLYNHVNFNVPGIRKPLSDSHLTTHNPQLTTVPVTEAPLFTEAPGPDSPEGILMTLPAEQTPAGTFEDTEGNPGVSPSGGALAFHALWQWPVLLLLWLAGFAALLAAAAAQSLAMGAKIRRYRPVTAQPVLDLLEECKTRMGVRAWLAVVEAPGVRSPALLGFVRPRLLLPEGAVGEIGPQRLRHVFLHELAHLKRRDIALNWLITLLQAVHWFNPLVWVAFRKMREDRELACDALVLASLAPEETRAYGHTIVHLLERFARPPRAAGLAGILEDKNQIRRRLTMIAQFRKPSLGWSTVAALIMLVLGGAALTSAQPKDDESPAVKTEREERVIIRHSGGADAEEGVTITHQPGGLGTVHIVKPHGAGQHVTSSSVNMRMESDGPGKMRLITSRTEDGKTVTEEKIVDGNEGFGIQHKLGASQEKALQEQLENMLKQQQESMAELNRQLEQMESQLKNTPNDEAKAGLQKAMDEQRAALEKMKQSQDEAKRSMEEAQAELRKALTQRNPLGGSYFVSPGFKSSGWKAPAINLKDLKVEPYEEGGLYTITASVENPAKAASTEFEMKITRDKKEMPGTYGIGPVKPGETWGERSNPFSLHEGDNDIRVTITPKNRNPMGDLIIEGTLVATVEGGKITKTSKKISEQMRASTTGWAMAPKTGPFMRKVGPDPAVVGMNAEPYPEGEGLFSFIAMIANLGMVPSQEFKVTFYRNDPEHKKPIECHNRAMKPGEKEENQCRPLLLKDGENIIEVVVDAPNDANPDNNRGVLKITLNDGRITAKTYEGAKADEMKSGLQGGGGFGGGMSGKRSGGGGGFGGMGGGGMFFKQQGAPIQEGPKREKLDNTSGPSSQPTGVERKVLEARLEGAQKLLDLTSNKFKAGVVPHKDLIQAETEVKVLMAQLAGDERAAQMAKLEGLQEAYKETLEQVKAGTMTEESRIRQETELKAKMAELEAQMAEARKNPEENKADPPAR